MPSLSGSGDLKDIDIKDVSAFPLDLVSVPVPLVFMSVASLFSYISAFCYIRRGSALGQLWPF